jgi:hypothetical protein
MKESIILIINEPLAFSKKKKGKTCSGAFNPITPSFVKAIATDV